MLKFKALAFKQKQMAATEEETKETPAEPVAAPQQEPPKPEVISITVTKSSDGDADKSGEPKTTVIHPTSPKSGSRPASAKPSCEAKTVDTEVKSDSAKAETVTTESNGNNEEAAPFNTILDFLSALLTKNYKEALRLSKSILKYEPNNKTVAEFLNVLEEVVAGGLLEESASSSSSSSSASSSSSESDSSSSSSSSSTSSSSTESSDSESDASDSENEAEGDPLVMLTSKSRHRHRPRLPSAKSVTSARRSILNSLSCTSSSSSACDCKALQRSLLALSHSSSNYPSHALAAEIIRRSLFASGARHDDISPEFIRKSLLDSIISSSSSSSSSGSSTTTAAADIASDIVRRRSIMDPTLANQLAGLNLTNDMITLKRPPLPSLTSSSGTSDSSTDVQGHPLIIPHKTTPLLDLIPTSDYSENESDVRRRDSFLSSSPISSDIVAEAHLDTIRRSVVKGPSDKMLARFPCDQPERLGPFNGHNQHLISDSDSAISSDIVAEAHLDAMRRSVVKGPSDAMLARFPCDQPERVIPFSGHSQHLISDSDSAISSDHTSDTTDIIRRSDVIHFPSPRKFGQRPATSTITTDPVETLRRFQNIPVVGDGSPLGQWCPPSDPAEVARRSKVIGSPTKMCANELSKDPAGMKRRPATKPNYQQFGPDSDPEGIIGRSNYTPQASSVMSTPKKHSCQPDPMQDPMESFESFTHRNKLIKASVRKHKQNKPSKHTRLEGYHSDLCSEPEEIVRRSKLISPSVPHLSGARQEHYDSDRISDPEDIIRRSKLAPPSYIKPCLKNRTSKRDFYSSDQCSDPDDIIQRSKREPAHTPTDMTKFKKEFYPSDQSSEPHDILRRSTLLTTTSHNHCLKNSREDFYPSDQCSDADDILRRSKLTMPSHKSAGVTKPKHEYYPSDQCSDADDILRRSNFTTQSQKSAGVTKSKQEYYPSDQCSDPDDILRRSKIAISSHKLTVGGGSLPKHKQDFYPSDQCSDPDDILRRSKLISPAMQNYSDLSSNSDEVKRRSMLGPPNNNKSTRCKNCNSDLPSPSPEIMRRSKIPISPTRLSSSHLSSSSSSSHLSPSSRSSHLSSSSSSSHLSPSSASSHLSPSSSSSSTTTTTTNSSTSSSSSSSSTSNNTGDEIIRRSNNVNNNKSPTKHCCSSDMIADTGAEEILRRSKLPSPTKKRGLEATSAHRHRGCSISFEHQIEQGSSSSSSTSGISSLSSSDIVEDIVRRTMPQPLSASTTTTATRRSMPASSTTITTLPSDVQRSLLNSASSEENYYARGGYPDSAMSSASSSSSSEETTDDGYSS